MDKKDLVKKATRFVESSKHNLIPKEIALSETVVGLKIFETPIFAFADADDQTFKVLKDPLVIGEHFMLPQAWLPEPKTVISFFLPFTEAVKKGNRRDMECPSEEWLHGRIEGQALVVKLCHYLSEELIQAGYKSLAPSLDERFWSKTLDDNATNNKCGNDILFTSNWSERHVAYICGLGTFGLSKGFITEKGIAGRFGSIITELELSADNRSYDNIYGNCSMCGACINNCPVNAISLDKGKNHQLCYEFINKTAEKYKPRYGCGKCQVGVPCESRIPKKGNTRH